MNKLNIIYSSLWACIVVIFILIGVKLSSYSIVSDSRVSYIIHDTIYIQPQLTEWQLFQLALIEVESEFDYGAENKSSKARGILQIMPIFVKEANRLQDAIKYEWDDAWNVDKSLDMFNIINPEKDIDLAIKRHNPNAGSWYAKRVRKAMDKIRKYEEVKLKIVEK